MLIRFKSGAADNLVIAVRHRLDQLGVGYQTLPENGQVRMVVLHGAPLDRSWHDMEGIEAVVPIQTPYILASSAVRKTRMEVRAGSLTVGTKRVAVIAGPCSVESRNQVVEVAEFVKSCGGTGLRGGAFKARTSPYSFQGLKEKGLEYLAEARDRTGLAIVTEVLSPDQVALVARYADVVQIGARNMQNFPLLEAAGASGKPVLLKRGLTATMEEFLLAAEYVLRTGNDQVILCERGVRTFEDHTRFTLPLASVPYLQKRTHLPVIVDPSHGTGDRELVPAMARAAVAVGADGLLIEVHPDPACALSDGFQALPLPAFKEMLAECRGIATALGRTI